MIWNYTMEQGSRSQIEELQLTRLRKVVERTYHNVPCYRAKMAAKGFKPDDIRTLADISKLPFTTKQDMRDAYPYGMLAVPMKQIVRVHCSSGTTGSRRWWRTPPRSGGMGRGAGPDAGSRRTQGHVGFQVASITGCSRAAGLPLRRRTRRRFGRADLGGNTARQVMLMKDFGTTAMIITPSYSLHLAETMREMA
jgi:phenylacetate-CoA ligase